MSCIMHLSKCLLSLLAMSSFFLLAHQQGLKCYECMSMDKAECANQKQISCPAEKTRCSKGYLNQGGTMLYEKDCVTEQDCMDMEGGCEFYSEHDYYCMTCCEGELCNDGEIEAVKRKPASELAIPPGSGAKCYICLNNNKEDCVKNQKETNCPAGDTMCSVSYLWENGVRLFNKDCVNEGDCKESKEGCEVFEEDYYYCETCCKGDLCNAGEIKVVDIKPTPKPGADRPEKKGYARILSDLLRNTRNKRRKLRGPLDQ